MRVGGFELRKTGTMQILYSDVDRVLREVDSAQMQSQTVAHALQKMLRPSGHFCVCTIRDCAEIFGLCIPGDRMQIYKAAHCLSWCDMMPEYRQTLVAYVLDDFRTVLDSTDGPHGE